MGEGKRISGKGKKDQPLSVAAVLLAVFLLVSVFLLFEPDSWREIVADPHSNRLLFILLMAVLPVFGVSILLFLVIVGIKFGTLGGILVSGLVMLFHMIVAFIISHSFLRPQIDRFLGEHHWARPRLPARRKKLYAFLFVAIPGLPYAVKNYLLALTGLPFPQYLIICWSVQLAFGIPFIVLGEAVKTKHAGAFFIAVALLGCGFWAIRWLRRDYFPQGPDIK